MSIHAPVRPTLAVVAAGDAQRQPTLQHLELRIGKMTCGHWASAIGKAVAATAGVTAVKVNPATKIAQIDYDPARAKIHDIVQSIRSGGYTVGTATLRIPIKGMHCSSCVVRLELALQMTPGVVSARADLVLSAIDIEYQPESISFEQIRKAIESAGYRVAEPKVEPGSETLDPAEAANEQEYRTLMRKFWFAAAVSIPVMALSYPNLIPGLRDWMPMGSEPEVKVTFADVAGVDEAKQELTEVVGFLKDPHTYGRLGARIPRGVLLVGPPGTGKTLIARAVAGEAGVRFFSITGSEFVEMFVGVGAARVRDLFDQARAQAPAIIFIDELDALGRARGIDFPGTGHDEKEQTLNQLLAEMDGFDPSAGIIVLAATNRPEVLDPALLRAGRFDRQVLVDRPDRKGRADILRVHLGKIRTVPDLDVDAIAGLAPGFTGADLANLVNEAALVATRRGADATALDDFTQAVERLVAGLEKKSRVISPREREVVAHHEMGHAIVAMALPGTDPVQKVSIIPRGIAALGYTMQRPTEDRFLMSRSELANRMAVLLGGRAAESLVFDEVSTGATDDLARATDIARNMAVRFGMTQELGQVAYEPETGSFLVDQTPMWRPRTYGDGTAEVIDHSVRRAPKSLADRIAEIPGVAAVEPRIAKLALLDIPGVREPATGQFVSLPESGQPTLNRLFMQVGRMPEPGAPDEVVVSDGFAKAHAYTLGSHFSAILNGRKRNLVIVGTAHSPEFIFATGPGDRMPDEHRFAIVWMSEKALASAYNLDGAFSDVQVKLLRDASEAEVIKQLDALLDPYGGQAAYGRRDQYSHAYIEHGLNMLRNMGRTLPPIFLLVAAFLINLTLGRIVALEREQIGLLKALGYRSGAIAWHYVKFVAVITLIGIVIGSVAGTWLGTYITELYRDIVRLPFLIFVQSPDLHVAAAFLALLAAILGALRALRGIVTLPAAVAMQPPSPPRFHRLLPVKFAIHNVLSQPVVMMLRNITGHPIRALFTSLGMALSTAILIASLFLTGTLEELVNVTYFMADRQDATVSFVEKRPLNVVEEVSRLPGVLAVEPAREVPVRIRYGNAERRVMITGRPRDADLSRIIDINLHAVVLPESGLAISSWLAQLLRAQVGDFVEIDLLEGQKRTVSLPITRLVEDYFGIQGMMDAQALARMMREAQAVNSVNLSLDPSAHEPFYDAIKRLPTVSGTALQRLSLANYREVMAVIVTAMANIYTALAIVIAFGVVYNSARISLSERARELASLRVLGFSQGEVLRILFLELALLTLLAQPPGWALGYGLAWTLNTKIAADVMRTRLIVEHSTYALASGIVLVAAVFSALVVSRRINRLDLVAVLKTRD